MNTAFHTVSLTLKMGVDKLCVSTSRIWTYLAVSGSCGNANLYSLVDIILSPFWSPNAIGLYYIIFIVHRVSLV